MRGKVRKIACKKQQKRKTAAENPPQNQKKQKKQALGVKTEGLVLFLSKNQALPSQPMTSVILWATMSFTA